MSDTGKTVVGVPEDVAGEFKLMKQRRKYRWMTLKLDHDSFQVSVEKTGEAASSAADFVKALPESEARYAVFDYEFTTKDGRKTSKIYFVIWTPAAALARSKMFYTSQRRALDKAFTGVEDLTASDRAAIIKVIAPVAAAKDDDDDWDPDA
jgi:cofilin